MPYAFVEPQPKGQHQDASVTHYVLELANGARMDRNDYKTQAEAVEAAHAASHQPLIPTVWNAEKASLDDWRAVEQNPKKNLRSPWRRRP